MDERLMLHAMLHGYLLKGDLDTGEAHPMGQRPSLATNKKSCC